MDLELGLPRYIFFLIARAVLLLSFRPLAKSRYALEIKMVKCKQVASLNIDSNYVVSV